MPLASGSVERECSPGVRARDRRAREEILATGRYIGGPYRAGVTVMRSVTGEQLKVMMMVMMMKLYAHAGPRRLGCHSLCRSTLGTGAGTFDETSRRTEYSKGG